MHDIPNICSTIHSFWNRIDYKIVGILIKSHIDHPVKATFKQFVRIFWKSNSAISC